MADLPNLPGYLPIFLVGLECQISPSHSPRYCKMAESSLAECKFKHMLLESQTCDDHIVMEMLKHEAMTRDCMSQSKAK